MVSAMGTVRGWVSAMVKAKGWVSAMGTVKVSGTA
jgi:hypothetical protein